MILKKKMNDITVKILCEQFHIDRDILDMADLIKANSACLIGVCPDDSKLSEKADLILKSVFDKQSERG